jgi:SPX domain protein involved in polyphosphate accumulation
MVKFGMYILAVAYPDWTDYYLDYNTLKELVRASERHMSPLTPEFFNKLDRSIDKVVELFTLELSKISKVLSKYKDDKILKEAPIENIGLYLDELIEQGQ